MTSEELEELVWEIRKKLYLGEKLTDHEQVVAAYTIYAGGCSSCRA